MAKSLCYRLPVELPLTFDRDVAKKIKTEPKALIGSKKSKRDREEPLVTKRNQLSNGFATNLSLGLLEHL